MPRRKSEPQTQGEKSETTAMSSEIVPVAALEGQSLMKTVGVEMQQIAVQKPRDVKGILEEAIQELDDFPELLDIPGGVIYHRKVGTDPETGKEVFARGLSIRAAEALGNRWDNSACSCKLISEDAGGVVLFAEYLDYERMTYRTLTRRVSRWYKKAKSREMLKIDDERFSRITIPAEQSRLIRELFCRWLPPSVTLSYERAAEDRIRKADPKSVVPSIRKAIATFASRGVTKSDLQLYLGIDLAKPNADMLLSLRGLWTALSDGQTTTEEIRGEEKPAEAQAVPGAPSVPKAEVPEPEAPEPEPEPPVTAPKPTPPPEEVEVPEGALDESPDEPKQAEEKPFDRDEVVDRIYTMLEDPEVEKHFSAKCRLIGITRPFLWADEDDATIKLLLKRLEG